MKPGLASRIPHTFDFEDYTPDEIVKIGLCLHNAACEVDEAAYADLVKNNYSSDFRSLSNGRWVRNFKMKSFMVMSERGCACRGRRYNQILQEDLMLSALETTECVTLKSYQKRARKSEVADENGYAVPPGSN